VADVRELRLYQIAQFRYNAESRRCSSAGSHVGEIATLLGERWALAHRFFRGKAC